MSWATELTNHIKFAEHGATIIVDSKIKMELAKIAASPSKLNRQDLRFELKEREPSAFDLLAKMKKLTNVNPLKPFVVFGPTPGIVTDVTVGIGGNLTFEYRAMAPKEMGNG